MPKSGNWGCFWPLDFKHLMLIFWDETWYTSSLGQNLDPSLEPPKDLAWARDFELLERVSVLKFGRDKP
jgi:hypothetical protein